MLSLFERIIIMAFIRDWYLWSSMGAADNVAKEFRKKSDTAQEAVKALYKWNSAGCCDGRSEG